MKHNRILEWSVNGAIVLMLCVIVAAAFTGSYYGAVLDKETYAPIYHGGNEGKKVSLMINVYWGGEYVVEMAEAIKNYGFSTTFFIGGSWAAKNADIVKKLYDMDFELGNHGYNHRGHNTLGKEENRKEIVVTENLLREITGSDPVKLFAPPSGAMGASMHGVCDELGYKVIMWTRDTIDWRDKDAELTYARAVKNLASGDLVLMHPTAHTLEALPRILEFIKNSGFSVVPVSENIGA